MQIQDDTNDHIEILFHDISYYISGGSKIVEGDCEYEHIVSMINEGYSSGELNKTDPEDDENTLRGWWSI